MPENEVKKFINKVIDASGGNKIEELQKAIEDAEKLFNEEDFESALNAFSNLLSAEANNAKIIAGYGKCLLKLDRNEEVKELLESLIALSKLEKNNKTAGAPEEYIEEVNINPNNHELRFKLAEAYLASNLRQQGIEQLLIIVKKDRKWEDDKARKKIIELLDAFGEDDPITSETRLKLSSIIFS